MIIKDDFKDRHNGPTPEEVDVMLKRIGVNSMEELIEQTVPAAIRFKRIFLPEG